MSKQYFFLYHNIEVARQYVRDHDLDALTCIGMNDVTEYIDDSSDRSKLMAALAQSERVITPDFHENPNAKDIIKVVLKCMYKDNMNRDKLWEYAHKHFPETMDWCFTPDGILLTTS